MKPRVKDYRNKDLRNYAEKKGVCLWQVAEAAQICDSTLYVQLRRELDPQKKAYYMRIIYSIASKQ